MQRLDILPGCAHCEIDRRRFLTMGCAACAGASAFGSLRPALARQDGEKVRIRIVYALHAPIQSRPDWPNVGFDFNPEMARIQTELTKRCAGFEFVSSLATGPEDAQKILAEDRTKDITGYLVMQMNCWNRVVQTMVQSPKPVLYADFQYAGSGGFLVYTAGLVRASTPNFGFVASSEMAHLAEAVRCFELVKRGGSLAEFATATARVRTARTPGPSALVCAPDSVEVLSIDECLRRMGGSKILAVRGTDSGPAQPVMGIPMQYVAFAELNDAWKDADKGESQAIADRWEKTATRIEGVSRQTLEESAAMYLAEKALLAKHGANAITINCLGGFYGGHLHAYPCLGFHELNNEGLVGGCECDVASAATMVAITALTQGRPGYISDPVIDTAKRQIIYAHCVAANRPFGPQGPTNPFEIWTHSEDRQGAAVRSLLPVGYMTTTLKISQERKQIVFHQGQAVANDPDDRACRTKLAVEPLGDIEKLFREWDRWGWHRVTFYGDLKQPVFALADALGWKVIEEA